MNFDPLSFTIGKHGDSGPVRDVISYLLGRTAGTAGEIWRTLTNVSVASFTAVSATLRELVVDVTPQQSGSGDPSPDNVRPISGWTGATIVVSPTQDAQDGMTYPVSWQSAAGTIYGGTLRDNGDGTWTLTVDSAGVDMGALDWGYNSNNANFYATVDAKGSDAAILCSCYLPTAPRTTAQMESADNNTICLRKAWTSTNNLQVKDTAYTDASAFTSAVSGQTLVYELATPQTYTLNAESVQALIGQNNIFADTGNINTITFREH